MDPSCYTEATALMPARDFDAKIPLEKATQRQFKRAKIHHKPAEPLQEWDQLSLSQQMKKVDAIINEHFKELTLLSMQIKQIATSHCVVCKKDVKASDTIVREKILGCEGKQSLLAAKMAEAENNIIASKSMLLKEGEGSTLKHMLIEVQANTNRIKNIHKDLDLLFNNHCKGCEKELKEREDYYRKSMII